MGDSTITALPAVTSVGPNDVFPLDQGGVTKKATASQIVLAGSSAFNPVAGNLTLTGGLVAGGVFTQAYTDGVVVDYVSPNGRISVGTADNIQFFTGGIANTLMATLNNSANAGSQGLFNIGGNLYADTGILLGLTGTANSYEQLLLQNKSNGAVASTDVVVSNNNATAATFYGNFGINSSGFTGSGALNQPNYTYLTATSGDLAIGTTTANGIHFVVNNGTTDAMTISSAGVASGPALDSYLASPPAIGGVAPNGGSFTSLSSSGTVSGVGFSNYFASPPAIGGTTPAAGSFTTLSKGGVSVPSNTSTDTLTNKTLLANGPNTVEATSGPGSSALSLRNRVDNGAFLISQRYGVSSQSLTAGTTVPAADRWLVNISTVNGTFLVSSAAGPNGDQLDNYLVISGAAGSTNPQWFTRMESQRTRDLASRPIVISFWAIQNSGSSLPISATISRANSTDNFSGVTGDNAVTCTPSTIPNGVWTKVTGVVTLTAAATTGLQLGILVTGTVGATASAIAQVQLEQGSVATPFEWEHPQQTLAKCQRYLPVISLPAAATYVGPATISSVTAGVVLLPFQVPARVVPTAASIPLTTGFTVQNTANSTSTAAVFNAATSTTTGALALTFVGATTGGGICYNTGANNIVFTGAEL